MKTSTHLRLAATTSFLGLLLHAGCAWESRVKAPEMDPEAMVQQCMELADADGDGLLTKEELKVTPGLRAALIDLDENKDDKLSRDEVLKRFKFYVESRVGLQSFTCQVTMHGRPLVDGHVKLVPEPFMADFIEPAEGEVINSATGLAEVSTDPELPGVRPGMYRVEITSPSAKIAAKYNVETQIGIEVAPVQQQNASYNFDVRRR